MRVGRLTGKLQFPPEVYLMDSGNLSAYSLANDAITQHVALPAMNGAGRHRVVHHMVYSAAQQAWLVFWRFGGGAIAVFFLPPSLSSLLLPAAHRMASFRRFFLCMCVLPRARASMGLVQGGGFSPCQTLEFEPKGCVSSRGERR
jgi:hypothetical protein